MKIEQRLITPARAKEMLALNTNNRNIRPRHVMKLARAISRGEWQSQNPAPIVLNGKSLLDGQHRLAAVIEANKPVKMWVATGAPASVMGTIDTGAMRNLPDTLRMRGETSATTLAGALVQLYLYKTQRLLGGKAEETPTHLELLSILDEHPKIRDSVAVMSKNHREAYKMGSPSLLTTAHYLFTRIDREDAETFFSDLFSGANLDAKHPVLALRRVLLDPKRPRARVLGAILVKGWNAWREGEDVRVLSWRGGGRHPESFPEINGAETLTWQ